VGEFAAAAGVTGDGDGDGDGGGGGLQAVIAMQTARLRENATTIRELKVGAIATPSIARRCCLLLVAHCPPLSRCSTFGLAASVRYPACLAACCPRLAAWLPRCRCPRQAERDAARQQHTTAAAIAVSRGQRADGELAALRAEREQGGAEREGLQRRLEALEAGAQGQAAGGGAAAAEAAEAAEAEAGQRAAEVTGLRLRLEAAVAEVCV
jgi:hypothetical protein